MQTKSLNFRMNSRHVMWTFFHIKILFTKFSFITSVFPTQYFIYNTRKCIYNWRNEYSNQIQIIDTIIVPFYILCDVMLHLIRHPFLVITIVYIENHHMRYMYVMHYQVKNVIESNFNCTRRSMLFKWWQNMIYIILKSFSCDDYFWVVIISLLFFIQNEYNFVCWYNMILALFSVVN